MKEEILIVGGAGYIGSCVNKELTQNGYHTIVYDNFSTGHREFLKWGECIVGDLTDIDCLKRIFSSRKIIAVIHLASYIDVNESMRNPSKYYINNVSNTINLLTAMAENNIKNIIFSSSASVYGDPNPIDIPILETQLKNPINVYGRTKSMIEDIILDFSSIYGMNYIIFRYFNAAGAHKDCQTGEWHTPETHLIPLIAEVILRKREVIEIFGMDYDTEDGTCIRDYIHISDISNAHLLALEKILHEDYSNIFNLGNGKGFSVKEVINATNSIKWTQVNTIEKPKRIGDPPILIADTSKIQKALGWKPKYTRIVDIVETAVTWHSKLYDKYLSRKEIG